MKKIILLSLCVLALTSSCKKTTTTPAPTPAPVTPPTTYTAVYLLASTTSTIPFATGVYFRTSSGITLLDSTNKAGSTFTAQLTSWSGGDICTLPTGSLNHVNLKTLAGVPNRLEVCCVKNSTIAILGYYDTDNNGNKSGVGPSISPYGSTGFYSSVACSIFAVSM